MKKQARGQTVAVVAAAMTLPWIGPSALGAQVAGGGGVGEPVSERVYVANQSSASVSVIDAGSGEVVATVDMTSHGFDANSRPHHTAVDADGGHWYVSLIGGGHVLRFTADNELVGRAEFETPGLLAPDPATGTLYVGRSMMAVNPPRRIGAIDPAEMDIVELDVFFPRPHALAVDSESKRVFAASLVENRFGVLTDVDELDLVEVAGPPHTLVQFAISPDGRHLVATAQITGKLLVFDAADPAAGLVAEVEVGKQPWHPVFSPAGDRVYFGAKDDDAVVVVETAGWTVERRLTAPGIVEPHGSAVTSDGRYLFVSNRNLSGRYEPLREVESNSDVGTVVKIDTRTLEVVSTIEVGAYPAGISIGPAG